MNYSLERKGGAAKPKKKPFSNSPFSQTRRTISLLAALCALAFVFASCDTATTTTTAAPGVSYIVKYNANGGSGTVPNGKFRANTPTALATGGFTSSGREFIGWTTDKEGNNPLYAGGAPYTATGDIEMFAQWVTPVTLTVEADLAIPTGVYAGGRTSKLTFKFDKVIEGLTVEDINVYPIEKGKLITSAGNLYELAVTPITGPENAQVNVFVSVAKKGYRITNTTPNVLVFNGEKISATLKSVEDMDGGKRKTTTKLKLTFDKEIVGLQRTSFALTAGTNLTGALTASAITKGTYPGEYIMTVEGITGARSLDVAGTGTLTVGPDSASTPTYPSGYTLTISKEAVVNFATPLKVFIGTPIGGQAGTVGSAGVAVSTGIKLDTQPSATSASAPLIGLTKDNIKVSLEGSPNLTVDTVSPYDAVNFYTITLTGLPAATTTVDTLGDIKVTVELDGYEVTCNPQSVSGYLGYK